MGAVVSCIKQVFRTIGNCIMAIVHAIGSIVHAIVNGIVSLFDILVSCLTCGKAGSRRQRVKHHTSRSRV